MYTPQRQLEMDEKPVSFGASEIAMDAMSDGLVDAAVVVCEGAGTVIVTRPEVLQALGAHMTGLIRTEAIPEIQRGLEERGCILLDEACTIDQVKGYAKAVNLGYKKIMVTITGWRDFEARQLWEMGKVSKVPPIVFAVHNTGIDEAQAEVLAKYSDIVWACASKAVRDVVGKVAKIQMGVSIPAFAVSDVGKKLILNRAYHFEDGLVIHRASLPLVEEEKQPRPLM
jgi:putative methanogenesis marker protein 8